MAGAFTWLRWAAHEDLASLFQKPTDTGDAVDARLRVRVPVKAGPHVVTVAFLEDPDAVEPARLQPYIRSSVDNFDWSGSPHLQSLTIAGPFHPGRRQRHAQPAPDFCLPSGRRDDQRRGLRAANPFHAGAPRLSPAAQRIGLGHAAEVLSIRKARRRVRRRHRAGARADSGEPEVFVPRRARPGRRDCPASSYRIGDFELASRLSFFLWSSIPDDELLRLAGEGKLKNPAVFDRQVRRMLADPKSQALVDNFAGQWLQLRNLRNVQPNTDLFPDFDDNLRQSFRRETELLFESIVQEDRSVLDLLTADYTFVNERLARHYGIPDIYGSRFRRVAVTDDARRGLLGQGSILRSDLACRADLAGGARQVDSREHFGHARAAASARRAAAQGKSRGTEASHHARADGRASRQSGVRKLPQGDGFHRFRDGEFRRRGRLAHAAMPGNPIDATGELADGTKVDGVVTLRKALVSRPELFAGTLTEKLLIYALGRGLDYRDMPAVRAILRDASRDNYRFSALILGVVHSTPFQMRTAPREREAAPVQSAQNREGK